MANIKVYDLYLDGSDLFMDSEGFMKDLTEDELNCRVGGILVVFTTTILIVQC